MERLYPRRRGIQRQYGAALVWEQQILDVLIALAILYPLTLIRTQGQFPVPYQILAMIAAMLMLIIYQWSRVYHLLRGSDLFYEARALARGWIIVLLALTAIGFVTKTNEIFSRVVLLQWAVAGYLGQLALHIVLRIVLRAMRSHGHNLRRAVLVGSGAPMRGFARRLARNPWLGIVAVGYVTLEPEPPEAAEEHDPNLPHLGTSDQMPQLVRTHRIELVYITMAMAHSHRIQEAVRELMMLHLDVHWVPDLSAFHLVNHSLREIEGQPVLCISDAPISGFRRLGKWLEDKILATVILVAISPLMLAIALAIKLTSPGPVLFKQKRAGLNGKPIEVYKFRSMVVHQEPEGVVTQATMDDRRVTSVGAFLRRTSLDELPQFFNVLNGTMSIVGPRPHAVEHNDYYVKQIDAYMLRHRIKPGITGWAQVNGWRGQTDQLEKMEMRVKHDLYYINNWSVAFDLMIIGQTIWGMLQARNAY